MNRNRKPRNPDHDHDELLEDLETDARDHFDEQPATRGALKKMDARLLHLEQAMRVLAQPGGPADGERLMAKAAQAYDGEVLLAKAAQVYNSPEGLMQLAERQITDPTTMGIFSGHISSGNLRAAQTLLNDLGERQQLVKAVDAAQDALETPLGEFDNRVGLSELTARFSSVERLLASIETRLNALESRRQAAPTVAKAAGGGTARPKKSKAQIADGLMRAIDAYIDSPETAGALSSLVQAGKFSEVRPVLERAKAAHETEKVRQERKSWGK